VNLQDAKTTAEIDLLLGGNVLVAKHHDVVAEVSPVNAGEIGVVQWAAKVEANDLGTDCSGKGAHFKSLRWLMIGRTQGHGRHSRNSTRKGASKARLRSRC
jgi:hypothetical protein